MPVHTAQRLCPDLIVLPPNPRLYARASRALHKILRVYAPVIEPRGYGHAFLDLTGTGRLFGSPEDVADRIRTEVRRELQLAISVGIASNKLVSQAAIRAGRREGSDVKNQLLYVPSGCERGFLAPQSLEVLPELDPRIRRQLDDYQLDLIGEVAAIPEGALCAVFGREGQRLRARARGIDPRPVLPPEQQSEFYVTHTLTTDTNDLGILFPLLRLMTERLGRRLRRRVLMAGQLRVDLTYADYTAASRTLRVDAASLDAELWEAARQGFMLASAKRLAVRTVALTLGRLLEEEVQLELWGSKTVSEHAGTLQHTDEESSARLDVPAYPPTRLPALQHAVDRIRARYGSGALRGSPLTSHFSPVTSHHSTTILPNVALPSMTRCASAS